MLWYKAWLETRWRFLIGLALLICSAAATVLVYPRVKELLPLVSPVGVSGEIGRQIKDAAELARDFRSYMWSQWFGKSLVQIWTLFAALLGAGGVASQASGGGTLLTLSLPVSRNRLLAVRGGAGLAQLLALAVVPSALIPSLAPAIGQSYSVGAALVQSLCLFVAGAAVFNLALLLSTVFGDLWRPFLIALSAAVVLGFCERLGSDLSRYGIFHAMRAEAYFRAGELPWQGLLASALASAAMLYGAASVFKRRDF